MSQTKVTCRTCHKNMATAHHGGAIRFTFGVVRSFDPTGPHGPCLWLQCGACGARRNYDLHGAIGPPHELIVKE